jgi:hypothetical protein
MAMALADFDLDGVTDIAVAGRHGTGMAVRLVRGNANGTFTSQAQTQPLGPTSTIYNVRAVDLDGTVTPDLVIDTSAGFTVLQGVGNGTFASVLNLSAHDAGSSPFVLVDVNNDGRRDLVLSSSAGVAVALQGACLP